MKNTDGLKQSRDEGRRVIKWSFLYNQLSSITDLLRREREDEAKLCFRKTTPQISVIYKAGGLFLRMIYMQGELQHSKWIYLCTVIYQSLSLSLLIRRLQTFPKCFRYIYIYYMNYHNLKPFIYIFLTIVAT